jgi:hypothetical protein
MKRLIAAVSFAVLATPVLAQSNSLGPTSPVGPSWLFEFPGGQESAQVASAGATRSDVEIATRIGNDAEELSRHVESHPGYFDPSN